MTREPSFSSRDVGNPVVECDEPDMEFDCEDDEPPQPEFIEEFEEVAQVEFENEDEEPSHLELDHETEPAPPATAD